MGLREHEKFWAFCLLGAAVLILVAVAMIWPPEKDAVVRVVDSAVGGMLLALGAASQALFRTNQADKDNAAAAKAIAESLPTPPQPVQIQQPPEVPVPVVVDEPAALAAEELPEYAR